MVIDHVLNAMQSHYDAILDNFIEAQRTSEYKKLTDNPFYEEVKALLDAMNILRKYLGWKTTTLKQEVEFYL